MPDPTEFMPATELAAAIRARRLSPVEVTRAALDRIERAHPMLNAFITIAGDQFRGKLPLSGQDERLR